MQTTLATRRLGTTDMALTTVGFGAWAVGGGDWVFGWGPQDDEQSIASIHHAVERGINWIDTAAVYGLGHSEEVVGRAVSALPAGERPYIFTKCGLVWSERDRMAPPRQVLRPESIRAECGASLRRLGIERIDLYQFHWPDETGTVVEDSWTAMIRLQEEGKIAACGVSNFDVALLERCESLRHVDSLQPPFFADSPAGRGGGDPVVRRPRDRGNRVQPHAMGLLTDRFTEARVTALAEHDWRRRSPDFKPPRLRRNLAIRDALRPIAKRHETTVAAVAIAWTLAWPGVTGAIVGARTPDQVDGWIGAASLELDSRDLDDILKAIAATGAGERAGTAEVTMGIHHITAIAGDPQRNLDFYTGTLGLRLVKLTVNFDDPGTYHFYFGDELGHPGSIFTFFPGPAAVPAGRVPARVGAVSPGHPSGLVGVLARKAVGTGSGLRRPGQTVRRASPRVS